MDPPPAGPIALQGRAGRRRSASPPNRQPGRRAV